MWFSEAEVIERDILSWLVLGLPGWLFSPTIFCITGSAEPILRAGGPLITSQAILTSSKECFRLHGFTQWKPTATLLRVNLKTVFACFYFNFLIKNGLLACMHQSPGTFDVPIPIVFNMPKWVVL